MIKKLKVLIAGSMLAMLAFTTLNCNKKLEEHPKTVFTVDFFKSPSGIQSAITTLYSGMRYVYGPEPSLAITVMGTDEFTGGDQVLIATGGQYVRSFALYGGPSPIQPSDGSLLNMWNTVFSLINTANGVVSIAPDVAMPESDRATAIAEARFLRGLYYLNLVGQFGAVPVDLGNRDLEFNQTPYPGFNILIDGSKDGVLKKDFEAMIEDFTYASQNLPDQRPSNAFRLSKAAAFMMLARTYVFKGYNNALKEPTDFQNAYTAAMEVINNQTKYGVALQQNFADVNRQGTDYNSEILYSVERVPGDLNSNEVPNSTNTAGKGNNASIVFAPDYTVATGVKGQKAPGSARQAVYGRPYRRFAPTLWLLNTCFADKNNDSRFNGSFQTMWYTVEEGKDGNPINYGDTAFVIAMTNTEANALLAKNPPYKVVTPAEIWTAQNKNPQNIYPYLKKFSDSTKNNYNDVVDGRPFKVAKFSEIYLLAAEACLQGAGGGTSEAAQLINNLKRRAAFREGLSSTEIEGRYNAIKVSAPDITLDFILDERSRELCGESIRFIDLSMRHKLVSRTQAFNPDAAPYIQPFNELRPIPQSQLDAVSTKDPAYQNTGYN